MKKIYILLTVLLNAVMLQAQSILSMHVYPANPVAGDTVLLTAEVSFPSGSCNAKSSIGSWNGNEFTAYSIHCLGPLSYICNDTDSFNAGVLAPGNYRFIFSLDAGLGPAPCSPGIVPGPIDTLAFTVSPSTGIRDHAADEPHVSVNNSTVTIKNITEPFAVEISDAAGKIIYKGSEREIELKGTTELIIIRIITSGDQYIFRNILK